MSESTTTAPAELVGEPGKAISLVKFSPDHKTCKFCAYSTLESGIIDYVMIFKKRFSIAWASLLTGDPWKFVDELHAHGYFTGDFGVYSKSVASLWREYFRTMDEYQKGISSSPKS